jgi:hypothetical protein
MLKKVLSVSLLAIIIGVIPAVVRVQAKSGNAFGDSTTVESAQRSRRFGPYATLRRANQVANYARRRRYKAKIFYAGSYIYGTRSYYVDVWR